MVRTFWLPGRNIIAIIVLRWCVVLSVVFFLQCVCSARVVIEKLTGHKAEMYATALSSQEGTP